MRLERVHYFLNQLLLELCRTTASQLHRKAVAGAGAGPQIIALAATTLGHALMPSSLALAECRGLTVLLGCSQRRATPPRSLVQRDEFSNVPRPKFVRPLKRCHWGT